MTTTTTYPLAQRLTGIASDSLYTFTPGTRQLPIFEGLTVTGHFTEHTWGIAARLVCGDEHRRIIAAAEASAPLTVGAISSRIRHFRGAGLLWTHTAKPVTDTAVSAGASRHFIASDDDDRAYHLWTEYDLSSPRIEMARLDWILAADGNGTRRFAELDEALAAIDDTRNPAR